MSHSSRRQTLFVFVGGFGFGLICLWFTFGAFIIRWSANLTILALLGGLVCGLLAVYGRARAKDTPARPAQVSPWTSLFFALYLAYYSTQWIGDYLGSWLELLVRLGLILGLGLPRWYLDYQIQQIGIKAQAGQALDPAQASRRRRLRIVFWTCTALQLFAVGVNAAYDLRQCSRLDLPRRFDGCYGRIDQAGSLRDLDYAPNGTFLTTLNHEGSVSVWSLPDRSLERTLAGANSQPSTVAISPDSAMIAVGLDDGSIRLWRARDGVPVQTLNGHTESVKQVVFSPDGSLLASNGYDNTIRLWRVADGSRVRSWEALGSVKGMVFAPDSTTLAVASGTTTELWDVRQGALTRSIEHQRMIGSLAIAPDGMLLAVGDRLGQVQIVRFADGAPIRTLTGHRDEVGQVAFSPDGSLLASLGSFDDNTVRTWRVSDGAALQTIPFSFGADQVAFGSESQTVAIGRYRHVYFWRIR